MSGAPISVDRDVRKPKACGTENNINVRGVKRIILISLCSDVDPATIGTYSQAGFWDVVVSTISISHDSHEFFQL
jgi:hypothetical protein